MSMPTNLKVLPDNTGVQLIFKERIEQIEKYGYTAQHHYEHPEWYEKEQLLYASTGLCEYNANDELNSLYKEFVPENWDKNRWGRLCDKPKLERLAIAGALIAAEIDRLIYIENQENGQKEGA